MHPIERLRWVARSPDGDLSLLAAEAADALAAFADDPAGLVIASRRLIERRSEAGPLWWLASRVLCSLDPAFEAIAAAADLEGDRTAVALAGDLPGGTVAIVGWPDQAAAALRMRARMGASTWGGPEAASDRLAEDPRVGADDGGGTWGGPDAAPDRFAEGPRAGADDGGTWGGPEAAPDRLAEGRRVGADDGGSGRMAGGIPAPEVDAGWDRVVVVAAGSGAGGGRLSRRGGWEPEPDAWGCADWLQSHGVDARAVPLDGLASAAPRLALVLLEATAVGPDTFVAPAGSAALAAAARAARCPVWLVAGVGRALPGPLYEALVRRTAGDDNFEVVPLAAADEVVGPTGPVAGDRLPGPACPVAAELLRFSG